MTDNTPDPKDPGFTVVVETDRHYWSYLPADWKVAHLDASNIKAAKTDHMVEGNGLLPNRMTSVYERIAKWPTGNEAKYV